jgi:glycosyltransferase involved in cell wall biosynthesis
LADASVLVVHDIYLLPLGRLLSAMTRTPFVYDAHEEYASMEAGRRPAWLLNLITLMETRLSRASSAIVVPGRSRQQRWTADGFEPPVVLPNAAEGAPAGSSRPEWDVAYCGTLSDVRRVDLLLAAARRRPDLQIAVAGRGRGEDAVRAAAEELPNVAFLGWMSDADAVYRRARAIYYGLDPKHPYSRKACPNTLYDALRLERPLVFFCGGEPAELAARFKIGLRCDADVDSLLAAVDSVRADGADWEFRRAWEALELERARSRYVDAIAAAAG